MKKTARIMIVLIVLSMLMLGVSACQSTGTKDIKEPNGASKDDRETKENENGETTKNDDNGTTTVPNIKYEKLDIKSWVSIKENYDYFVLDRPSVDFELKDLNGNTIKLSDYKGQIVFLNFWATWCPPCKKEMPDMESIHRQYGDKGVTILGVSSTELELRRKGDSEKAKKQVEEFINKGGFTFTIPLDADNEVLGEYNRIYPIMGIPTTFILDREGVIRYVRPGYFLSEEQLKAFIALVDE